MNSSNAQNQIVCCVFTRLPGQIYKRHNVSSQLSEHPPSLYRLSRHDDNDDNTYDDDDDEL